MEILAILFCVIASLYMLLTIYWRFKVIAMLEALAEAKGFRGDTSIFRNAILWTGTLGAITVLAMPDKNIQKELKTLRAEVAALREGCTKE